MARMLMRSGFAVAAFLVGTAGIAAAQNEGSAPAGILDGLKDGIIGALIYSALGLIILLIGFKVFDLATPFSLNKEIAEDNNVAAGVAVAGIMIALGLIVASAIS